MKNSLIRVLLVLATIAISACSNVTIKNHEHDADLHDYKYVYINKIDIYSKEPAAKDNQKLQNLMVEWEGFARDELERHVSNSSYELTKTLDKESSEVLVVDLDVDLVYGNRAARYWGGFGAGKGSVDSNLTVSDSATQDVKYNSTAESELTMGALGGDMQALLKDNIKALIKDYPVRAQK